MSFFKFETVIIFSYGYAVLKKPNSLRDGYGKSKGLSKTARLPIEILTTILLVSFFFYYLSILVFCLLLLFVIVDILFPKKHSSTPIVVERIDTRYLNFTNNTPNIYLLLPIAYFT
jgi:hypothetical protein